MGKSAATHIENSVELDCAKLGQCGEKKKHSFSVSLKLSASLKLSLSSSQALSLSLSFSLSLSQNLFLSLSKSLSLTPKLSNKLNLSNSLSLSLCDFLCSLGSKMHAPRLQPIRARVQPTKHISSQTEASIRPAVAVDGALAPPSLSGPSSLHQPTAGARVAQSPPANGPPAAVTPADVVVVIPLGPLSNRTLVNLPAGSFLRPSDQTYLATRHSYANFSHYIDLPADADASPDLILKVSTLWETTAHLQARGLLHHDFVMKADDDTLLNLDLIKQLLGFFDPAVPLNMGACHWLMPMNEVIVPDVPFLKPYRQTLFAQGGSGYVYSAATLEYLAHGILSAVRPHWQQHFVRDSHNSDPFMSSALRALFGINCHDVGPMELGAWDAFRNEHNQTAIQEQLRGLSPIFLSMITAMHALQAPTMEVFRSRIEQMSAPQHRQASTLLLQSTYRLLSTTLEQHVSFHVCADQLTLWAHDPNRVAWCQALQLRRPLFVPTITSLLGPELTPSLPEAAFENLAWRQKSISSKRPRLLVLLTHGHTPHAPVIRHAIEQQQRVLLFCVNVTMCQIWADVEASAELPVAVQSFGAFNILRIYELVDAWCHKLAATDVMLAPGVHMPLDPSPHGLEELVFSFARINQQRALTNPCGLEDTAPRNGSTGVFDLFSDAEVDALHFTGGADAVHRFVRRLRQLYDEHPHTPCDGAQFVSQAILHLRMAVATNLRIEVASYTHITRTAVSPDQPAASATGRAQ
ncbi:uncharacterized protein MONBRDRAFT_24944 [Monosiga brevicollis MX1]|uniref:Uncharacterized protein n=1 Tax=Monosiga brevicollis TaxID=81824 RepID=A9UY75_MONBE|nr:uncharacterized protein MONBRDRAFT_24944 [Monosiga brevicollis MX1]EDQ89974.1 predicted protein [Monosiga brevicollis MX1]|eukprot:XP_001745396.1 hypothetical protein [Monosiga brevicollis MX1]